MQEEEEEQQQQHKPANWHFSSPGMLQPFLKFSLKKKKEQKHLLVNAELNFPVQRLNPVMQ